MTIKQQGGIFGRNPTFNDVTIDGTFSSSGNMSITGDLSVGTDSASSVLHVKDPNSVVGGTQIIAEGRLAGYGAGISFQSQLNGGSLAEMAKITADGEAAWNTTSTTQDAGLNFYTSLDGSISKKMTLDANGTLVMNGGNVKFLSGDGIDFSATSDASGSSSELFDDYEEGTWTPTLLTGTATASDARYTKIGNMVYARATLSSFSDRSTASNVVVSSLPYAPAVNSSGGSMFSRYTAVVTPVPNLTTGGYVTFYGNSSGDYLQLQHSNLSASASAAISFNLVYRA